MDIEEYIDNADEALLREMVKAWANQNDDFREYVSKSLKPAGDETDFDEELADAVYREACEAALSRSGGSGVLNWSNIYYYKIEPWVKDAENLSTDGLMNLIITITVRVADTLREEDFFGNDWYGNDYSSEIGYILNALGYITGLALTRDDLPKEDLKTLHEVFESTDNESEIQGYINTPYKAILEMIDIREDAGEVTVGIYDRLIEAGWYYKGGYWTCRKIDFIRSMGLADAARQMIADNLRYPDVCLKGYSELVAESRWSEAINLLDEAEELKDSPEYRWTLMGPMPDWLAMKQQLLTEHGTKEDQIANLRLLFHKSILEKARRYYAELKKLVEADNWKDFYHKLLSEKLEYLPLDEVAPFLIIENEYEWLYSLLVENERKRVTDYETPLKYTQTLFPYFGNEMQAMLVRTFRAYAADRFGYKKRVKQGSYQWFANDLQKLVTLGASQELKELVTYFREEYSTRPSFMTELRKIDLK